jgi:hypothetical protein
MGKAVPDWVEAIAQTHKGRRHVRQSAPHEGGVPLRGPSIRRLDLMAQFASSHPEPSRTLCIGKN